MIASPISNVASLEFAPILACSTAYAALMLNVVLLIAKLNVLVLRVTLEIQKAIVRKVRRKQLHAIYISFNFF